MRYEPENSSYSKFLVISVQVRLLPRALGDIGSVHRAEEEAALLCGALIRGS